MDKTTHITKMTSRELKAASDALFKDKPTSSELRANQTTIKIVGARQTAIKVANTALGIDIKVRSMMRANSINENQSTRILMMLARHDPLINALLNTASATNLNIVTYNRQITQLRNSTFLADMESARKILFEK